jgi:hypothetical protein
MSFSDLPALNACLNGISAVFLVTGLVFIKKGRQNAHRNCMIAAFGASILFGRFRTRARSSDDDYSTLFAALGGVERRNTSKAFEGADLTAVFGGAELDLRDAEIVDRPARINAVALFGGAEVIVPRDWNVRMDVLPILGGASDDRPRREEQHDSVDLEVTGFVAFGGISVSD